jgi:hypothetical protein
LCTCAEPARASRRGCPVGCACVLPDPAPFFLGAGRAGTPRAAVHSHECMPALPRTMSPDCPALCLGGCWRRCSGAVPGRGLWGVGTAGGELSVFFKSHVAPIVPPPPSLPSSRPSCACVPPRTPHPPVLAALRLHCMYVRTIAGATGCGCGAVCGTPVCGRYYTIIESPVCVADLAVRMAHAGAAGEQYRWAHARMHARLLQRRRAPSMCALGGPFHPEQQFPPQPGLPPPPPPGSLVRRTVAPPVYLFARVPAHVLPRVFVRAVRLLVCHCGGGGARAALVT